MSSVLNPFPEATRCRAGSADVDRVAARSTWIQEATSMRFMMLYKPGHESDAPPSAEHMAEMGRYIAELTQAGVLLATDGLQSSKKGTRVRITGHTFTVTDGPFTEAKELIAGFAIIQAASKEEAIGHAKRFLTLVGEGESEIRLMHEAPALAR
jgi:hypothetical protein